MCVCRTRILIKITYLIYLFSLGVGLFSFESLRGIGRPLYNYIGLIMDHYQQRNSGRTFVGQTFKISARLLVSETLSPSLFCINV